MLSKYFFLAMFLDGTHVEVYILASIAQLYLRLTNLNDYKLVYIYAEGPLNPLVQ
jgi:hypothetical protein